MKDFGFWPWILLLIALATILLLNASKLIKFLIKKIFGNMLRIIMTDDYKENLLELYSAAKRFGPQRIMELNLRAETGQPPERPLGSNLQFPNFEKLMLDVAQLHNLPLESSTAVDLKVVIGPRAKKPLKLEIPIIVAGMAYGLSLSAKAKVALARGASLAGTATNNGSGPFLQTERDNAKLYIYQYNRGSWGKDPSILRQADAIEIQFGQGAIAGLSRTMQAKDIDPALRAAFQVPPGCDAVIKARFLEMDEPADLTGLVAKVRSQSDGVPVGVKMAASRNLELDLQVALAADVDFICLCGCQAGTAGGPPSVMDSYALPTLFALVRARRFLELHNAVGKVSLIISGGFGEPGEMLKALALGADAVYIGTAAIFAISHTQVLKALPWEPPTQIIWYNSKYADQFDENKGAQNLANYLNACKLEMEDGMRIMGKTALNQLSKKDLFSLDKVSAEITGVVLGYQPQQIRYFGNLRPKNSSKKPISGITKTTTKQKKRFGYRPAEKFLRSKK